MVQGINNREQLKQLFDNIYEDYKHSRKVSYEFWMSNPNEWQEIHDSFLNDSSEENVKILLSLYNHKVVKAILTIMDLLNVCGENRPETEDNKILCDESDILYLACQSQIEVIKSIKPQIIDEVDDFLAGKDFHENVMEQLYFKYVGNMFEVYPDDIKEWYKISQQEREMLDALYFWLKFEPNSKLLDLTRNIEL